MVEIFRTNVTEEGQAVLLLKQLQLEFPAYRVNFDLEDSDNILRITSKANMINTERVISFVQKSGYVLQLLPDEPPGVQLDRQISKVS